jgi:hypothetical protein
MINFEEMNPKSRKVSENKAASIVQSDNGHY